MNQAPHGSFHFRPIGYVRSAFPDKFGIPRQPRLVTAASARIELLAPFDREEAFEELDGFSHVWVIFVFHQDCLTAGWNPKVRPPRLGGRRSVGVFASRAPYRPNPIGISALAHDGLVRNAKGLALQLRGADLLDGTPVLDIKPYIPYADALPDACQGFSTPPQTPLAVRFSEAAERQIAATDPHGTRTLRTLITQVLAQDPRPGYMDRYPQRCEFAIRLYELDVRWRFRPGEALVTGVVPASK